MRACRSLEEFYAGDKAAHAGELGDIDPKLIAQDFCATGRFNDTPICRQLGITPAAGSPMPGQFFLGIANLDGPPVDIEVNGTVVATVSCQLDSNVGGPTLTPGPDLPLPWTVRVLRRNGVVLGSWQELGDRGPRQILIRGEQAVELASDVSGGPQPTGTCPK
jgi:hypothetical protein